MPYLGKHTLAECAALAVSVAPKLEALNRAYIHILPAWETRDIFAATRFKKDLAALTRRWNQAVAIARKVSPDKIGGGRMTAAEKQYQGMVKAIRQGGEGSAVMPGDLIDLARKVRTVYTKTGEAGFGFDWPSLADVTGVTLAKTWMGQIKSLQDCTDLVVNYQVWFPQLKADFERIQAAWNAKDPTANQAFMADLVTAESDWDKAFGTYQTEISDSLKKAAQGTVAEADLYTALHNAADEWQALHGRLRQAQIALAAAPAPAAYTPPVQPPSSPSDDLSKTLGTGVLGTLGDVGHVVSTATVKAVAAAQQQVDKPNPMDEYMPWIKGGLIVGALGVVGFFLSEIRSFLPASSSASAH